MRLLLEKGADTEAREEGHWTPLYLAARLGREQVVRLLLEKGADIHVREEDQWTPLHVAARLGRGADGAIAA